MLDINKIKNSNLAFIIVIFLLSAVFLHNIISTSRIMSNIHHINDVTFISQNLKESLFKYRQLHLWTPYYYSGQPLYAQPEYYFLDFNLLYLLLFRDIFIAMNLATLTYFFLAGLGMYFLFLAFSDSKHGAFIASIIYMFNGYMHSFVIGGNLNVLAGYSLIPFAFMFFVKALSSKNFAKNAVFSGLFVALQVFAGSTLFMTYEIVLFGLYAAFCLFGKNLGSRIFKVLAVSLIVMFVSFGVSAIKLLPGIEFLNLSNRAAGVSYQEYLGKPIQPGSIIYVFVTNLFGYGISASIGIAGFLLLIFSLHNYKKRFVIFSITLIIVSFLMAVKGPVADLFFKIPVFNQLRHIERAILLSALASSILAGHGFSVFSEKAKKLIRINKDMVIFSAVVILILTELMFLQNFPKALPITTPKDIPVNDYISKDTSRFRTINLALSTLVGASGYNYLAQLGIGTIKGGGGIWFNDYLYYLSIAQQTNPSKLWGLLNNKYVIANKELNIQGLRFIGKFSECKECPVGEAYGPYLYENLDFMPRAYFTDKAILVVGSKKAAEQVIYSLILNDNFNPKKTVVVQGKESISNYGIDDLNNYNAVIITGPVNRNEIQTLSSYAANNGILLPDILNNRNSISDEDIKKLFNGLNGTYEEIEILKYENNKAIYNVNSKKGFLVLSERFSNFPGWEASGKYKKEILKANVIITSVFIDNDNKLTLEYLPKTFRNGALISFATFVLLIVYFVFSYKNTGDKNKA